MLGPGLGLVLCITAATATAHVRAAAADLTRVPGTRISLEVPAGFTLAPNFSGLMNQTTGASLMVTAIEAPTGELLEAFKDADRLRSRGLEASAILKRPLGEHVGRFVEATQTAGGQQFSKLMWVFGDGRSSIMLVGTCASARAELDLPLLRRALDSVHWDPALELDPFEGLTFRLNDLADMQLLDSPGVSLGLTPDGEPGLGKPMFIAAPGLQPVSGDPREYAKRRFKQVASYRRVQPSALEAIEIDGLRGFACVATAEDPDLGTPTFIYEVMLFESDAYWLFQGIAAEAHRAEYLPRFKRIARGFARQMTRLRTLDGRCEVTLPQTWTDQTVAEDGDDLYAGHSIGSCFVQVLSERRSDLPDGLSLRGYRDLTLADLDGQSGPVSAFELGPHAGLRSESRSEVNGEALVYLRTWVEEPEYFHQVLGYFLVEAEEWSRPELERVLASFRVLDPEAGSAGER